MDREFIVRETGYPGAIKQEVVGELVRRKDCKHCRKMLNGVPGELEIDYLCEDGDIVSPEHFCSGGVRRE